jgi:6-phosphogluconate dehydrogenase
MTIGYIGLGKMGANMVKNLLEKKHKVHVYDIDAAAVRRLAKVGAQGSESIENLVQGLQGTRTIWVMVPHQFTEGVVKKLSKLLKKGDTIIDGGNSPFKQSIKLGKMLEKKGINFLDIGVSGGPKGARNGACMMVGGKPQLYKKYTKLIADLCVPKGFAHMGPIGSGHFVKMVHNGIEYGMMQAMAEGFTIMKKSKEFKNLNLKQIADVYNHGSVIESQLMEWMLNGFTKYGNDLKQVTNQAGGLGEGAWTVEYAHEVGVRDKVLHEALKARKYSKKNPNYQAQVIMALRNQFGGHSIKGNKKDVL